MDMSQPSSSSGNVAILAAAHACGCVGCAACWPECSRVLRDARDRVSDRLYRAARLPWHAHFCVTSPFYGAHLLALS